jgi:anti-anti-sigma factor
MEVEVVHEIAGNVVVVEVRGEVDLATVDELGERLDEAVASAPRAVICDLRQVTFLAAVGLHCLQRAAEAARFRDVALITVISSSTAELPIFRVMRPLWSWPVHRSVEDAVQSVSPR